MQYRASRGSSTVPSPLPPCSPAPLLPRSKHVCFPLFLAASLPLLGCNRTQQTPPTPPPPVVLVSLPITRSVTAYEDFTGRTDARRTVDIRARATGFLQKFNFKEGSVVEKDAVLFEIDPAPYDAETGRALANLNLADVHAKRLNSDFNRAQGLILRKAISQEEFDKIAGDLGEAVAAVKVAQKNLDLAKLNLSYCRVKAPISGRLSRNNIDPGNLVKADDTVLTTLVSLDDVYVYFDVDERTWLLLRRLIKDKKIKPAEETPTPVLMGLADEEDYRRPAQVAPGGAAGADGYPHVGTINFTDNRVDAATGTMRLRGLFQDVKGLINPGLFVRIRLPLGESHPALLVTEKALGTDQGQKFVYVVLADGKVEYRKVEVGRLYDGLREITRGVKRGEKVVVTGLQRVRPGIQVKPRVVAMPLGKEEPAAAPKQATK
jgi:RND family efflux transporter MFP subunit